VFLKIKKLLFLEVKTGKIYACFKFLYSAEKNIFMHKVCFFPIKKLFFSQNLRLLSGKCVFYETKNAFVFVKSKMRLFSIVRHFLSTQTDLPNFCAQKLITFYVTKFA
jgi:hypothetical protein